MGNNDLGVSLVSVLQLPANRIMEGVVRKLLDSEELEELESLLRRGRVSGTERQV